MTNKIQTENKKPCLRCNNKGRYYFGWKSVNGKTMRDRQIFCQMCRPIGWRRTRK